LQTQAKEQSSQLGLLQQQVESKERESRKLRIVQAQVNEVLKEDPKTVMYEGVGKMSVYVASLLLYVGKLKYITGS